MEVTSLKQIGPYTVERFIDAGAFAWVFEVVDPKFSGRRLALKMLKPEAAAGEEFRRFQSEARLLAQIDHPNLVTIFDFGKDETTGNFYYVMTFVDGPTLKERLKEGPISVDEAVPIFVSVLDGLARLHENGVVHRDIKPANVLLGLDGRARLADLGIARVQAEGGQTRTGVAVGTALYMSPEQARGRSVDERSDLFSLGLSLYQTLTGRAIYDYVESLDSSSGMDVLMYIGSLVHTSSEFDVRFESDSTVPVAIQRAILKSLRLDPEERFESATQMCDALREAMEGPVGVPTAPGLSIKAVGVVGGALALVIALVGTYFFYWTPQQELAALRSHTTQQFEAVSTLSTSAIGAVHRSKELNPGPPEALLAKLDDQLQRAAARLRDGRDDLEANSYELALKNFERSLAYYTDTCQLLVDQFLLARAGAGDEALRNRALQMSDRGAEEIAPEQWQQLTAVLPRAAAPERACAGCEAAEVQLARVLAALEGAPLADAIERELAETWPKLADAAYKDAVASRQLALAKPADARDYKLSLKEAKRFLLQGSRYRKDQDFQTARDAYRAAGLSFATASAIALSAPARDEAQELAKKALAEGVTDMAEPEQLIARGNEAYAAEQWQQATDLFARATARLQELREVNALRLAAVALREEAITAREKAVESGAEKSAPTEFASAQVSMANAESQLELGDSKRAQLEFAASRDGYTAARERANEALRQASAKQAEVVAVGDKLVRGGSCADMESEETRQQCQAAVSSFEQGKLALEALDARTAIRNFYAALQSYARASSAQMLWDTTRPLPPKLVRRVPESELVTVDARRLYSFAIEARDPNGDPLQYTWTVDGEVQEERGPTLQRSLEQSGTVAVKVEDGNAGELVEQWRVEVGETPGG
jgi:hypothetical protein